MCGICNVFTKEDKNNKENKIEDAYRSPCLPLCLYVGFYFLVNVPKSERVFSFLLGIDFASTASPRGVLSLALKSSR